MIEDLKLACLLLFKFTTTGFILYPIAVSELSGCIPCILMDIPGVVAVPSLRIGRINRERCSNLLITGALEGVIYSVVTFD